MCVCVCVSLGFFVEREREREADSLYMCDDVYGVYVRYIYVCVVGFFC